MSHNKKKHAMKEYAQEKMWYYLILYKICRKRHRKKMMVKKTFIQYILYICLPFKIINLLTMFMIAF